MRSSNFIFFNFIAKSHIRYLIKQITIIRFLTPLQEFGPLTVVQEEILVKRDTETKY